MILVVKVMMFVMIVTRTRIEIDDVYDDHDDADDYDEGDD